MLRTKVYIILVFLCAALPARSEFLIEGRVFDAKTREPVAFANIFIKGTTIGASTDDTGYYKLVLPKLYDSLSVAFLGYSDVTKNIEAKARQFIVFELGTNENELFETVIYADKESLEDYLIRMILEHKPKNDRKNLQNYQYASYNKVEIDIKNISDKTQNRKLFKPFNFIFDNIDSTSEEEPFLPMMLSETISKVYYSNQLNKKREVIEASKISGVNDETFSEFLGSTYTEYNIYDNAYSILYKEFISPIAANCKLFYKYRVIDTLILDNVVHYRMEFQPRGQGSNTFFGYFVVSENNFAIKSIRLNMARHVNINFVRRLEMIQDFEFANGQFWMLNDDNMVVEFEPFKNKPSVVIRKNASYRDFSINDRTIDSMVDHLYETVQIPEDAAKDPAYWDTSRFVPLSKSQSAVYHMIDTLKTLKAYKSYVEIFNLVIYGYLKTGPVEFGSISSFISYNALEGWRFKFGMQSNSKLCDWAHIKWHVAYGIRDKAWKGGTSASFLIGKRPRQLITASYLHDVSKTRRTSELLSYDNLINNLILRKVPQRLLLASEAKLKYEIEWKKGYSADITIQNRRIQPKLVPYQYLQPNSESGTDTLTTLNETELVFHTRLAIGEDFLNSNSIFRKSLDGWTVPTLQLEYVLGVKGFLKSQFPYHKITLLFSDIIPVRPIGRLEMKFQAGKVFGNVPFFLSEVHDGNQTFMYTPVAFTLMNDYEFYSDQYVQWIFIHHFDGFFFNKIPGIRKLKIREYVDFRGVWGNVTAANKERNALNPIREVGRTPYLELGFGFENILKIFKFGFEWRLTHRVSTAPKWGFLFGLEFNF
jgi:Family of unknown function (DUF5686)/CarboxypepD_reg-like domain